MKLIKTVEGETLRVNEDTPEDILAILKEAVPLCFAEFVYTGNHPAGVNSGNYEELEDWLKACGLDIWDDSQDFDTLLWNMDKNSGIHTIEHRGKILTYHVQGRKGTSDSFGYTRRLEFRKISCS
jgi:hypothetical protein